MAARGLAAGGSPHGSVSKPEYPFPYFSRKILKPLCEICETRHELYQGHVFVAASRVGKTFPVANGVVANKSKVFEEIESGIKAGLEKAKSRYKDLVKRRTYMRDLMRKRRAKPPR